MSDSTAPATPSAPPAGGARRRWPWVTAGLVVLLAAAGAGGYAYVVHQRQVDDAQARALASRVAAALTRGDVSGLPATGADGAAEQTAYAAATKGLGPATATVSSERRTGDAATAVIAVRRTLAGGAVWAYDLPVAMTSKGGWRLAADQRLVHPELAVGETIKVARVAATRAPVLAGDGSPVVTDQPVVDVGVQPSRVTGSVDALAQQVSGLTTVDAADLARRIKAAPKDSFVDVITLRRSDYDAVKARLRPLPGVVLRERTQPLAPTRDFARALLGSVGPVTAEMVTQGGGRYAVGDVAGVAGLQRRYDAQLGGTAGVSVTAVPAGGGAGRALFSVAPRAGTPLRLTLDTKTQLAADAALRGLSQPAALVAVDVRTGAVLAVANSPSSGLDRALVGRYPPGSTFKIVTTLSLLQKGLKPTDPVLCPPTATVGGRSFTNYESERLGSVPFSTDFAQSCNTAFVGLSSRLGPDDLRATAASLGIGATYRLGTDAFSGSIPTTTSDVDRAAASFGQGRDEVSVLSLAVATGSIARSSYLPPTLVVGSGPAPVAAPLPSQVSTLHILMRGVVTGGTGTALASVPGGPVFAKTGTAEFGAASPPLTRAWITGWQGDVAFSVLVEQGKSGGTVAGPVAARFLTGLR